MRIFLHLSSALCFCAVLTGCATLQQPAPEALVAGDVITGTIHGGQSPISGSAISLWVVGTSGYGAGATKLLTATSSSTGTFSFSKPTCPYANAPTYILAAGGVTSGNGTTANANTMLGAALGPCSTSYTKNIAINEVTTAAMAYSMAQFFTTTLGSAGTTAAVPDPFGGTAAGSGVYNQGLVYADQYTAPVLVNSAAGTANVTATSGTLTTTLESAKLYSLANSLAACVNSTGETSTTETTTNCGKLFSYTTPPGATTRPYDTLQAAVQVVLYPYQNVNKIYTLTAASGAPFIGLSTVPNDWTLGVSYTASNLGLSIYGTTTSRTSSSIDIDETGNIWMPSNLSTAHGLVEFSPSTASFSGPYATNLIHPQYVAISNQGAVYGTDLNTAQISSVVASAPGRVTTVTTTGFTGPVGAAYGSSTTSGGVTTYGPDSIDYTGGGSSSSIGTTVYRMVSGSVSAFGTFDEPPANILAYGNGQLDIDAATNGSSTVCRYESLVGGGSLTGSEQVNSSTSVSPCFAGGIIDTVSGNDGFITTSTNQLCNYGYDNNTGAQDAASCFTPPLAINAPQNGAIDGSGNLWIANSGNASITTLGNKPLSNGYSYSSADYVKTSTVQYIHNSSNGGTLTAPYGMAIDRSGNVWVSNAGCVVTTGPTYAACTPGPLILSELVGAAAPTITPLASQNVYATYGTRPTSNAVPGPVQAQAAPALSDNPSAAHGKGRRQTH